MNRSFELDGKMYVVTSSELVETYYGPETRVHIRCINTGEKFIRQEPASTEMIVEWFKQN